jgi:hypothetical protein
MERLFSFVAYTFFGYVLFLLINHHGARWEFGQYGFPHALIGQDGVSYLDGIPVEPMILGIVEADLEVEAQLALYAIVAGWLIVMMRLYRQINRNRRDLRRSIETNDALRRRNSL